MPSIVDHYKSRPEHAEFDDLCLASFCSEYRVLPNSEVHSNVKHSNPVYELQNGLGYVQKRSRTNPAVVRYVRFSESKEPEKYFQSILQLFLPYRKDCRIKPRQFKTYQNFYEAGAVRGRHNKLELVQDVVQKNRAKFEIEAEALENAEKILDKAEIKNRLVSPNTTLSLKGWVGR